MKNEKRQFAKELGDWYFNGDHNEDELRHRIDQKYDQEDDFADWIVDLGKQAAVRLVRGKGRRGPISTPSHGDEVPVQPGDTYSPPDGWVDFLDRFTLYGGEKLRYATKKEILASNASYDKLRLSNVNKIAFGTIVMKRLKTDTMTVEEAWSNKELEKLATQYKLED